MVKCDYCGEDAITHTYKQWEEHDRQWEEDVEDSDAFQQTGNYHTRSAESVEEFREGKREIYRYKKQQEKEERIKKECDEREQMGLPRTRKFLWKFRNLEEYIERRRQDRINKFFIILGILIIILIIRYYIYIIYNIKVI